MTIPGAEVDGVILVSSISLQPQAACYQCKWQHGPSVLSKERAINHAKDRRHLVRVWSEQVQEYAVDEEVAARERRVIPLPGQEDGDGHRPAR